MKDCNDEEIGNFKAGISSTKSTNKKIISLLMTQIVLTCTITVVSNTTDILKSIVHNNIVSLLCFASLCVLPLVLHRYAHSYPLNIITLFALTVLTSLLTTRIAAIFAVKGYTIYVVHSSCTTLFVLIASLLYTAAYPEREWNLKAGFVISCTISLFLLSIFLILYPDFYIHLITSSIAMSFFSALLHHEVSRASHRHPDDIVIVTFSIYIDLLNLFMSSLQFFALSYL